MIIPPLFLSLLQKALNQYLAFDPEVRARLTPINDRVLRITITTFDCEFYVKVNDQQIIIIDRYNDAIDASMSAGVSDYLQVWMSNLQNKTEIPKNVVMTGDIHFIQTINDIFKQADINWEEQLAKITGDIVAHQIGNVARFAKNCLQNTTNTITANLSEYLQEEKEMIAHRYAIEDFCHDVDLLRADLERMEARVKRI